MKGKVFLALLLGASFVLAIFNIGYSANFLDQIYMDDSNAGFELIISKDHQQDQHDDIDRNSRGHSSRSVQKVHVKPIVQDNPDLEHQAELKHLFMDGINSSKRLELTNDELNPEAVWVVYPDQFRCNKYLIPAIKNRLSSNDAKPWKIFLLDWSDSGLAPGLLGTVDCIKKIIELFNSTEYVYFATRSHYTVGYSSHYEIDFNSVKNDNDTFRFTEHGNIDWDSELTEPLVNGGEEGEKPVKLVQGFVQPLRFAVRSDLVKSVNDVVSKNGDTRSKELGIHRSNSAESTNSRIVKDDIPRIFRAKGCIHFWNVNATEDEKGGSREIRDKISDAILELAKSPEMKNFVISAHEMGDRSQIGRRFAQDEYAKEMLSYKIVVVSQRDEWEDHYRLMEAFVGGSMVMTDPMHPMPIGLSHKKNVIVYNSLSELKSYIKYYLKHEEERLEIAIAGYQMVMSKHRSWHLMERLIFGDWDMFNWGEYYEPKSFLKLSPMEGDERKADSSNATVMAMAAGYSLVEHRQFVGSLRKSGFSGHIILAVKPDLDTEIKSYLEANNVTTKYLQRVQCTFSDGATSEDLEERLTCLHPYPNMKQRWSRFPLLRDYLLECNECTGPVLVTDFRDTFFQKDPFGDSGHVISGLEVYEEHVKQRTTHWLVEIPVSLCKGVTFDEPMLCSGTTLGTRQAMMDYLEIMHKEMELWMKDDKCGKKLDRDGEDQSIHNYLFYTGKIPFATAVPNRKGIVNTVGVQGARIWNKHKEHFTSNSTSNPSYVGANEEGRWLGLHFALTDKEGYFLNFDGTKSAVVHQYDRFGSPIKRWMNQQEGILWN